MLLKSHAMTEKKFEAEQKRFMKQKVKEIETELLHKLEKSFVSGAIPDEWKTPGNFTTTKAVIDSFCLDRPYKLITSGYQKDAANLHLFI